MTQPAPTIRLPLITMMIAGPAGAMLIGLLAAVLSMLIPRLDGVAAAWGAVAAAGGLVIGLLFVMPWKPGTPQSLTMRMFGGQGVSLFATLACGAVVWFAVEPEPLSAGLTAAGGYFAGLMLQIAAFGAAARSVMRPSAPPANELLDNPR